MTPGTSTPGRSAAAPGGARARRMVIAIALVVAAPVLLSYGFYYFMPPASFTNYGELLPTQAFPGVAGARLDGKPFDLGALKGQWTVLIPAPSACDDACAKVLYATRQARAIQGKNSDRVVRVWMASGDGRPAAALLAEHPDLVVTRVPAEAAGSLPKSGQAIFLIDPIGNQVLAWPRDPDIKAMARDLGRLLKASRIG